MAIEIGVFFLHVCIIGAATLISLRLIWGKDRPSKMHPFLIPVFAMALLLGFLMGKVGAFDLWAMIGSFFVGVLILLVNFAIVANRQMKPLLSVLAVLAGSTKEIAASSTDISTASQDLSEGSSMQLAAVADTSTSLEELFSMTNSNVETSKQANGLMSDTQQTINRMSAFMKDLTVSMGEISKASEETSKIIKSIDEIAFQTNLLALNAAVEAARAGAAGAGFAVVANEVRNLAMRSAEAARNTADLIEGTVRKIKDGAALVNKTNQEFTGVAASASKIGNLIEEITAVSQEQVQAIKKIDGVIREIDHAIGQNSALADGFDAAADDTTQQIDQMRLHLRRMASLIGWSGKTKPLTIGAREGISGMAKRQSLPEGKTDRKNLALPAPARTAGTKKDQ